MFSDDAPSLDVTMLLMALGVKLCTFSFNVADGARLSAGERLSIRDRTHQFRMEKVLPRIPPILEFMSFVYFFPAVLLGPCFEIKPYLDFINETQLTQYGIRSLPSSVWPTIQCLLLAALAQGGNRLAQYYPLYFVHSRSFGHLPWLERYKFFTCAAICARCKFYLAWYLSEAGCVASGFSFQGFWPQPQEQHPGKISAAATGLHSDSSLVSSSPSSHPPHATAAPALHQQPLRARWDRVRNVNVVGLEFGPHVQDMIDNWNMGVHHWLKHYVRPEEKQRNSDAARMQSRKLSFAAKAQDVHFCASSCEFCVLVPVIAVAAVCRCIIDFLHSPFWVLPIPFSFGTCSRKC
jgi:lysophospholipid acyltransferase